MYERGERSMLRDYLRVLRRRKWIFLQAVVIVPVAVVLLAIRQTPLYQASAEVLLKNEDLAASLTGTALQTYQDPIRLVQTQADLARVPAVAQQVLEVAHVPGMTPSSFLAASSVSARQDADILEFSVTDRDAGVAARLATCGVRRAASRRRASSPTSFCTPSRPSTRRTFRGGSSPSTTS